MRPKQTCDGWKILQPPGEAAYAAELRRKPKLTSSERASLKKFDYEHRVTAAPAHSAPAHGQGRYSQRQNLFQFANGLLLRVNLWRDRNRHRNEESLPTEPGLVYLSLCRDTFSPERRGANLAHLIMTPSQELRAFTQTLEPFCKSNQLVAWLNGLPEVAEARANLDPGTLTGSKRSSPPATPAIQPDQAQSSSIKANQGESR